MCACVCVCHSSVCAYPQNIARPRPGRNSGMGVVVDMRKRQAMQAAVQTMHGAAQMVLDAKKTLPAIPDVDLDRVSVPHSYDHSCFLCVM